MLKALEICGFKSFADKTRFEFPPGITVIVGPNGSGKSNIVDAIKWVLGEQSAKSLRGKDMSDVIFKGSTGAGARKPANSATAALILDNTDRRFPFDADEVHVERRVYRSGESEYLINGENSRLKDIRNLFRGTGIGTDAYSLIEQGKVDRLLQANAKDRRAIFEEAAGISRFRAKKIEAERRLARVDASLIRLADIVEEVGSRYRRVKSQASKAVRYKEHTERLQQLRTYVGMKDWRAFSEKLEVSESEARNNQIKSAELQEKISERENTAKRLESELDQISASLQTQQELAADHREAIAQAESMISLNESRLMDLDERDQQLLAQIERSNKRTEEFKSLLETTTKELENAELIYRQSSDELQSTESKLGELESALSSYRAEAESNRVLYSELIQFITEVGRLVSSADSQVQSLTESQGKYHAQVESLTRGVQELGQQHQHYCDEQQRINLEAESSDSELGDARRRFEEYKNRLDTSQKKLGQLATEHAGMAQRAEVIEELEKRLEGINAGAKELLQMAQMNRSGPMGDIIGLVADLVTVNIQHAGIVDVALGDVAQYIVVDGERLVNLIADERLKVHGRVGMIQLDSPPTLGADPNIDLNGLQGVIGRADRLVQIKSPYSNFVHKLLGGTWVVKTLTDALHLHNERAPGARFVSLDGEVVEADGTVIVGPKTSKLGLVSRRSELRALRRDLLKIGEEIEHYETRVAELQNHVTDSDSKVQLLINKNSDLAAQLYEQTSQANATEKQRRQYQQQLDQANQDGEEASIRLNALESKLVVDRKRLANDELQVERLDSALEENRSNESDAQTQKASVEKSATLAKVRLAKSEQQLEDLQSRHQQYNNDYVEHQTSVHQLESQLLADRKSRELAETEIAQSKDDLALQTRSLDELKEKLTHVTQRRSDVDGKRRQQAIELSGFRDQLRNVQDQLHQAQLRVEQLTLQREQLADRLREDYSIEIAAVEVELSAEELEERDEIDSEITTLRKKIGAIGSVNADALNELEELESRYLKMDEQYQDLIQAKDALEKIIIRINADSRKLFVETLEAIRINFQKLFRQTFGGGHADIVLEEGVDPLEAGVEIIATPPGKPSFDNALLSGGEKALTAVSLLMAIFQFRPSPFCVLDEVDAPFDEANIGRFIDVLKSFLGWTKFVIVTHSKKTMTAATTLYGVTMEESGVSKRVSVRFEDVSEDGQISDDAIDRADDAQRGVA